MMTDLAQIMGRRRESLFLGLFMLCIVCPDFVHSQAMSEQSQANVSSRSVLRTQRATAEHLVMAAVSLHDNQLDVDVQNQDLHDILNDIATQGDITISKLDELPKKQLSLRFSKLPVVVGLKRLFRAAEIESYVLMTEVQGNATRVQRIVFFPPSEGGGRSSVPHAVRQPVPSAQPLSPPPTEDREGSDEGDQESGSVFDELKTNTAARRLLSQLVHPNEQVRERALERLVRLVDGDDRQAELLEFLEPLMENLSSEDNVQREEARQEVRKLLQR
jgi:hypothetical protein